MLLKLESQYRDFLEGVQELYGKFISKKGLLLTKVEEKGEYEKNKSESQRELTAGFETQ